MYIYMRHLVNPRVRCSTQQLELGEGAGGRKFVKLLLRLDIYIYTRYIRDVWTRLFTNALPLRVWSL